MEKYKTFEEWLQEIFSDLGEIGGVPIMKDNCEDMFDGWLANHDVNEMIEHGENYGKYLRAEFEKELLKIREILTK